MSEFKEVLLLVISALIAQRFLARHLISSFLCKHMMNKLHTFQCRKAKKRTKIVACRHKAAFVSNCFYLKFFASCGR